MWCAQVGVHLVGQGIVGQQLLLASQLGNDLHLGGICVRQPLCHSPVHSLYHIHKSAGTCNGPRLL